MVDKVKGEINMDNKVKLITPFLMLLAGSLASIIMYIRKYDFYTMLWILLVQYHLMDYINRLDFL